MVLSERERRLLQEMETQLLAEDPRLATSLSVRRLRVNAATVLAVPGLAAGVLLMGVGVWRGQASGIAVALAGYLVLLASTSVTVDWLRSRRERRPLNRGAGTRARRAS
jgi:hypothetical protein